MNRTIRALTLAQYLSLPEQEWLIDGMMPAEGIGTMFGPIGSGKTFVGLDLALTMASGGGSWMGHHVQAGRVVYVAAEGQPGLQQRLSAWQEQHPDTAADLVVVPDAVQLLDRDDVAGFIKAVRPAGEGSIALVVYDAWSGVTAEIDENSRTDLSRAVLVLDRLRRALGSTALLIHHTGASKEKSQTPRGTSAFLAAMDFAWLVQGRDHKGTIKSIKMRDAKAFETIHFQLVAAAESCVVDFVGPRLEPAATLASGQRTALSALAGVHDGPSGLRAGEWMKRSGMPESSFFRARLDLLAAGHIAQYEDKYWLPDRAARTTLELPEHSHGSDPEDVVRLKPDPSPLDALTSTALPENFGGSASSTPPFHPPVRGGGRGSDRPDAECRGSERPATDDEFERWAIEHENDGDFHGAGQAGNSE